METAEQNAEAAQVWGLGRLRANLCAAICVARGEGGAGEWLCGQDCLRLGAEGAIAVKRWVPGVGKGRLIRRFATGRRCDSHKRGRLSA